MGKEWLTTGEMIDRLKVGEIAVNENKEHFIKQSYGFVACEEDGTYYENKTLKLHDVTLGYKWRILPKYKYVSFEEAMKAHLNGQIVAFHSTFGKNLLHSRDIGTRIDCLPEFREWSFKTLFDGKWTIEE